MMAPVVVALRAGIRRPMVQDAALACGLLVACLLVNDAFDLVRVQADRSVGAGWGGSGAVWAWWVATAFTVVAVTLRRRRPVPMLIVCAVSTIVRVAVGVLPTVMDLAVLVLLCTVAARCSRLTSLLALAGLLLGAAWLIGGSPVDQSLRIPTLRVCSRSDVPSGPTRAGRVDTSCHDSGSDPWRGLPVLGSGLIAAWAVGNGSRNRRAYLEQLHARAQDLEREQDHQATLAVAAERGRISREVHDVVAHGLSLIVVQAQGAEAALDNRPADTRAALQTIVSTGRDSLADMRRVLGALGEVEDAWHAQSGLARLPSLLTRVRDSGTPVNLRIEGSPAALPSPVDLSAYRIVQEALTNVMKHAGPGASADVVVSYSDTEIAIEVGDDGKGPTGDGAGTVGSGNGLPGMRRRVTLLGGHLSAGPGDAGGFVVRAGLPIHRQRG
ncbi:MULTISPECIES: sensor histidine kinase [Streptacidiphilus]|uniref:histidine kinase n=1 Tax=Streptacidiphilus cavernicola TaxID=3342716 RepID=A0ABV6UYK2_9ACTN|nr:sensor histidine kinase [Streptacidiphilus jeojiense]